MQTVLKQGSIDKPLTFDVGMIQLSFIPVSSLNTATFQSNYAEGLHFSGFHSIGNQNTMIVYKMRDRVPSERYSSVYNVLRLWKISLIPTYRVYRLYDT